MKLSVTLAILSCPFLLRSQTTWSQVSRVLKSTIETQAAWALLESPQTITTVSCERSAGGLHDYYSEGDYWWPDPADSAGPYIQRDGQSNPDNFNAHRELLIRFSRIMGVLGSAYLLTKDQQYITAALRHARAWFVDGGTLMNPSLMYAQAIQGRATGRGIGIIDTIHLMEVVQTLLVMEHDDRMDKQLLDDIKKWFGHYLVWLTTHRYGIDEMNAKNNHGTCWVMQVCCFARFVGDTTLLEMCRDRFKKILLPTQMAIDGSFPLELARTKPFGYSIFNLDAMSVICQILSSPTDNLWEFIHGDRGMKKGIKFLYPYLREKEAWPFAKDVMYWNEWPVAQPLLVFGSIAFQETSWMETWVQLDHDPQNQEVLRNLPVRNPLIWLSPE
jgi:hypothetical protein